MLAHLWLWLGRWAAAKGLTSISDSCCRIAGEGHGDASVEALLMLGKSLAGRERFEQAIALLRRATERFPGNAKAWCAFGTACRQAADMPAARAAYERALEIDPVYLDARTNLGEWHLVSGNSLEALQCFDAVLQINPSHYEAITNRIVALIELALPDAEVAALAALKRFPDKAPLYVNLGNVYAQMARPRDAAANYRKALGLDHDSEEAAVSLATLVGSNEMLDHANEFIRQQIAIRGESIDRLCRLVMAQMAQKSYMDAKETCEKILLKQSDKVLPLVHLGTIHGACGEPMDAIECFKKAILLKPELSHIHSNILFESTYLGGLTREEVFLHHEEWAAQHETPLLGIQKRERRCREIIEELAAGSAQVAPLRIGYVSGDFGSHPVGFLIRDILRCHDRQYFEVYCYSQLTRTDHVTEEIKSIADHWVEAFLMDDDELADRIVHDRIDILVDLSGHTGDNRLKVFAMRPAPVQATWIGYFHSTGLRSIDYFITDPYSSPVDAGQLFSETPVYLPHSRFCYSPPGYAPPVSDSPFLKRGIVTFGSFNRLSKLTDEVVRTWVKILLNVPGSRLILKSVGLKEPEICDKIRSRFLLAGLPSDRLDLRPMSMHQEMYLQYGDVDIALDPFPFNGGMTTLEALWMGVPVVALAGDSVVSRQSAAALANIGLSELVFPDQASYIAGAMALAGEPERLNKLRRDMRRKMSASPLCQAEQFTADLEMLYRRMWQAWCRGGKLGSEIVPGVPVVKKTVLHVGCGEANIRALPPFFQRGWGEIRLDINPAAMPDVVASMLDMSPVESASVDAIFSSHNIEHLHPHEVGVALAEFRRVLKADGLLVLTCPDLQSVCALVANDNLEEPAYVSPAGPIAPIDILYGLRTSMATGNLYMAHKTGFTAKSLRRALKESGFQSAIVERGGFYDLWALAYPEESSFSRIESDKTSCFPHDEDDA